MATVQLQPFAFFLEGLRPDLHYVNHGDLLAVATATGYIHFKVDNSGQMLYQTSHSRSWDRVSGDVYSENLWKPTLRRIFGPPLDAKATPPRAEPVKTSQPQDMQTTASELRQQEATLLQKHRERQKELKKVAKAFSRVICEGMRARLLDPERIKVGSSVRDVQFDLMTLDPDEIYRQLFECMADSGFNIKRDGSRSTSQRLAILVN